MKLNILFVLVHLFFCTRASSWSIRSLRGTRRTVTTSAWDGVGSLRRSIAPINAPARADARATGRTCWKFGSSVIFVGSKWRVKSTVRRPYAKDPPARAYSFPGYRAFSSYPGGGFLDLRNNGTGRGTQIAAFIAATACMCDVYNFSLFSGYPLSSTDFHCSNFFYRRARF